jgi:hypothetical protein
MPRKAKHSGKAKGRGKTSKCIIPSRVADEALDRFTLGRNENEADRISDYVEWQCSKDKEHMTYLEKVMTEHVFSTRYDCWNVRTNRGRFFP